MKTPTISFIGSGHVAFHLATLFSQVGCPITQIWSRQLPHAQRLASLVSAEPLADLHQIDSSSDIFILAINDDAIPEVASQLHLGDKLLIHTAGSVSINTLSCATSHYGCLWPVQSLVADKPVDYSMLPFCIEGCYPEVEDSIANLVALTNCPCYRINGEQRRWAHLFAAIVSNFGNALNAIAQTELTSRGINFDLLRPLIAATAQKATADNLWQLQTGPARRHDQSTINAHLALLSDQPQLQDIYRAITRAIQSNCPPR